MKDNTIVLVFAEGFLGLLGVVGLLTGQHDIALLAGGAMAGALGGHLNGTSAGSS